MKPTMNDFENASQDFLDNIVDATTSTAFIIFPMSLFSEPIDDPKVVFPGLFDSYAKGAGFEAHQCQLCQKKLSSANSEDTDALNLLQQNCYQLQ